MNQNKLCLFITFTAVETFRSILMNKTLLNKLIFKAEYLNYLIVNKSAPNLNKLLHFIIVLQ